MATIRPVRRVSTCAQDERVPSAAVQEQAAAAASPGGSTRSRLKSWSPIRLRASIPPRARTGRVGPASGRSAAPEAPGALAPAPDHLLVHERDERLGIASISARKK